jgi:hypothetical protein
VPSRAWPRAARPVDDDGRRWRRGLLDEQRVVRRHHHRRVHDGTEVVGRIVELFGRAFADVDDRRALADERAVILFADKLDAGELARDEREAARLRHVHQSHEQQTVKHD